MTHYGVDPRLLCAWLTARSIARSLPPPVSDRGGFRVDTRKGTEICRWVFPAARAGLTELARTIQASGYLLKLCGEAEELRGALPPRWRIHPPGYLMVSASGVPARALPPGYRMEIEEDVGVINARIWSADGELAASGYSVETMDVFIHDRIVTTPAHRRWGLGHALMAALGAAKRSMSSPSVLVATADGKALYEKLGWTVVSSYSTASIPD